VPPDVLLFQTAKESFDGPVALWGIGLNQMLERASLGLLALDWIGSPRNSLYTAMAVIWNELLIALTFLAKDNMRTLMVGITTFKTRYMLDVPVTMAGLLMTTVPMLLLYAVFQRSFIRGLTEGSLKG